MDIKIEANLEKIREKVNEINELLKEISEMSEKDRERQKQRDFVETVRRIQEQNRMKVIEGDGERDQIVSIDSEW